MLRWRQAKTTFSLCTKDVDTRDYRKAITHITTTYVEVSGFSSRAIACAYLGNLLILTIDNLVKGHVLVRDTYYPKAKASTINTLIKLQAVVVYLGG
jgi:hypothetical protein